MGGDFGVILGGDFGLFLRVIFKMRVELFLGSFFRGQGGLVGVLKNRLFLGLKKAPKNGMKNGLKMQ